MKVIFFENGNTACFDKNGKQVPELQYSWLKLYFKFMVEHDIDPLEAEFTLPDGRKAVPFESADGFFGWSVE